MVTSKDLDIVRANWGATPQPAAAQAAADACFRELGHDSSETDSSSVYGPARKEQSRRSSHATTAGAIAIAYACSPRMPG